jgi:hypothetical protein
VITKLIRASHGHTDLRFNISNIYQGAAPKRQTQEALQSEQPQLQKDKPKKPSNLNSIRMAGTKVSYPTGSLVLEKA